MGHTPEYQEVLRRLAIVPEAGPGRVDVADALGYDIEGGAGGPDDH